MRHRSARTAYESQQWKEPLEIYTIRGLPIVDEYGVDVIHVEKKPGRTVTYARSQ